MKKLLAVGFMLCLTSLSVRADCYGGHWLQTKNTSGSIITLEDGSVWKVINGGNIDSMLWLPTEDILLCDDGTMINTDSNNEQVDVVPLTH